MKKTVVIAAMVMIIIAAMPLTAFARGHGGNSTPNTGYSVCTLEDCTQTGLHYHDSTAYAAHYYGDGHDYHGYCGVTDCAIAGYHDHDGTYCFGRTVSDGYGYRQAGRGCCRR